MRSRWLVAVSLLLLASCGEAITDNPTTTSIPGGVIGEVTLTVSGGIAGLTTTVTVGGDGVVTVVEDSEAPRESVLPETDLSTLHSMVGSPEFAALLETYVPSGGVCCDFFFYEVTAEIGEGVIRTTTADTVETPLILQQVIDLLSGLTQ